MTLKLVKLVLPLAVLAVLAILSSPASASDCTWTQSYDAALNQWNGMYTCPNGCSQMFIYSGGQWNMVHNDCGDMQMY